MLPQKYFCFKRSEIDSGALLGKKCDFCIIETESSFAITARSERHGHN